MIDYHEVGEGAAVLFLPGSFSTSAAWRAVQGHLPPRYRLVATSLCGYGKTAERRTAQDCGIEHEVAVVEAAARRIGAPVHMVGHSFGATVALAAALSRRIEVLSLVTFEANPMHILAERGRSDLLDALRHVKLALEAACQAGDRDAVRIVIDFWGGDGSFAAMPPPVQDYCRQTVSTNLLDWETAFGFKAGTGDFATLEIPVLLVRGGQANPVMAAMTEALAGCLPDARIAMVEGANHFLIASHPEACARLLAAFLADFGSGRI